MSSRHCVAGAREACCVTETSIAAHCKNLALRRSSMSPEPSLCPAFAQEEQYASRGSFEEGALAALLIVAASIGPVAWLTRFSDMPKGPV
jgi:hypothetical protein